MRGSRIFTKGREIFGTPLLQMYPNNIMKLCKGNRYHYSVKVNQENVQQLNNMFNALTLNFNTTDTSVLDKDTQNNSLMEKISEELAKLNLLELKTTSISNLILGDIKTISSLMNRTESITNTKE